MAHIKGTSITLPFYPYSYFDDFDDPLPGTSGADTIEGLGGDDHIWGGLGDDVIDGGAGNDVIEPTDQNVDLVADWGFDKVHGGPGTDTLYFVKTTHSVHLYGDEGTDFISGGSAGDIIDGGSEADYIWGFGGVDNIAGGTGQDTIYAGEGNDVVDGGDENDKLFGDGGDDQLFGGDGSDQIYGGYGHDWIVGEAGKDELWGGLGHDTFMFYGALESDPANPDHIVDFQAAADRWIGAYDKIDVSGPAGTASNYFELSIGYGDGYNEAKDSAEAYIGGDTRYVFVTDGVDGYFFSDVNGNGTLDNGIVLDGLNSLSDFSHKNVVDLF